MELDHLKESWQRSAEKKTGTNIRELLQNKNYGPIANLRNRFKKRLALIPIAMAILIINLSKHHDIFSDVIFWIYVLVCFGLIAYFYINYRLLGKMQNAGEQVKNTLEKQVHLLEKGVKWRLRIIRGLFIFFMMLLEVMLYFQQEPSLVKWYSQPIALRLAGYAGLFILFYFFSGFMIRQQYEKHIRYLKELVKQME